MESLKILVVDDEARMRKLVKDFLTIKGFTVIEAEDGKVDCRAACCTASGNFYPTAEPVVPDYAGNERLIIRRKMRKR